MINKYTAVFLQLYYISGTQNKDVVTCICTSLLSITRNQTSGSHKHVLTCHVYLAARHPPASHFQRTCIGAVGRLSWSRRTSDRSASRGRAQTLHSNARDTDRGLFSVQPTHNGIQTHEFRPRRPYADASRRICRHTTYHRPSSGTHDRTRAG